MVEKTMKDSNILNEGLNLTDEEAGKLGDIVTKNKFKNEGVTLLYPIDNIEKLKFFLKSYRYLFNLINNSPKTAEGVPNKIMNYLKVLEPIYNEGNMVLVNYEESINYNKHRKKMKIIEFVDKHRRTIEIVCDDVFKLGKVIKTYNPDESSGFY